MPYLSAQQLYDWQLWLAKYHPYPDRDDPHWAMSLCMFHNANCERSDAKRPEDFLIYHERFDSELTADQLREKLGLRG